MISPEELAVMWKESEGLRTQLRDEVVYLREKVDQAAQEIKELEARIKKLEEKK